MITTIKISAKSLHLKTAAILVAIFTFMLLATLSSSLTIAAQEVYPGHPEGLLATGEWLRAYRDDVNFDALASNAIVHPTSDSGYIVASSTYPINTPSSGNISILKLYADGGIAWRYEYGGSGSDNVVAIEEITDGEYIVLGNTESGGIWLSKLDATGSILWQKTYANSSASSLDLTQDGGYIVSGSVLLKLNSDGTIAWQKAYDGINLGKVQSTSDGGYLVAGSTETYAPGSEYNPAALVMKLNATGEISWQKTYGGGGASQLQRLASGEHVFINGSQLIKIDGAGAVVWAKDYRRADSSGVWLYPIAENADGSFLLIGRLSETINLYEPSDNIWISKVDSVGDILWQKTIGENIARSYWAFSGQGIGDNYVVTGSRSYGPGDYELIVLKLNASGEIPDCTLCGDGSITVESRSVTILDASATSSNTTIEPENANIIRQTVSTQVVTICGEEPVPPPETAPENVTFYGPTIGQIGASYDFVAEVGPLTTSLPLNFAWNTTEQASISNTSGLTDTVSYVWNTPGLKNISTTVNNNAGSVTSAMTIAIGDALETVETGVQTVITSEQTFINIPANAVSEATQLLYTNVAPTSTPSGFSFAGFGFTLDAYRNNVHQENFIFQEPVTVTMQYSPTDVAGMDESALKLYFWSDDEDQWIDAATSCTPTSVYERQPGQIAVAICHLSEFALFGPEQYQIYLPMLQR